MRSNKDNLFVSFFQQDAAGGILLMLAAVMDVLIANSPFYSFYQLLLSTDFQIRLGTIEVNKPLLLWVNDGFMAIFFFVVGLELKREFLEGELAKPSNLILPGVGAFGGMFVPALVYYVFNRDDPAALQGWAIPAATDIAFALGVVALLGKRIPISIKIFITSLAIFDDVGAIIIIAFFYTSKISYEALLFVGCCLPLLAIFNHCHVMTKKPYLIVGVIMWVALLKSGVHATLAGVILAFFIPISSSKFPGKSPLKELEHSLSPMVAFFILPLFAFANAGVSFRGMDVTDVFHDVSLGIALGLFLGKQVGIFCLCYFTVKLGWAKLPTGMTWERLYGAAALCGIGFTMSLFIGSLAFEETGIDNVFDERLGILIGSIFSGVVGYCVLASTLKGQTTVK